MTPIRCEWNQPLNLREYIMDADVVCTLTSEGWRLENDAGFITTAILPPSIAPQSRPIRDRDGEWWWMNID